MDREKADALLRELRGFDLPGTWARRSLDGISYGVRYQSPGGTKRDFFNREKALGAIEELRDLG